MHFGHQIINLTPMDFLDRNLGIVGVEDFINRSGINISPLKYSKLKCLIKTALTRYQKVLKIEKKTDTVQNFCMRIKKGSKRFRKILDPKSVTIVTPNILSFSEITDTTINWQSSAVLNSLWSKNYFGNYMKTFLFKLHNNILGTNSRVSKFVGGHESSCTFCDILKSTIENKETISHLFFDCDTTERLLNAFYSWIFNQDREIGRLEFFVGFLKEEEKNQEILTIVNCIVKKYIWDCKLRHTLPDLTALKSIFVSDYNVILRTSASVRKKHLSCGILTHINGIHF